MAGRVLGQGLLRLGRVGAVRVSMCRAWREEVARARELWGFGGQELGMAGMGVAQQGWEGSGEGVVRQGLGKKASCSPEVERVRLELEQGLVMSPDSRREQVPCRQEGHCRLGSSGQFASCQMGCRKGHSRESILASSQVRSTTHSRRVE